MDKSRGDTDPGDAGSRWPPGFRDRLKAALDRRHFRLKGVVSDEAGKPLGGVTVYVDVAGEPIREKLGDDGRFAFDIRRHWPRFMFSKEGYYSETFTIPEPPHSGEEEHREVMRALAGGVPVFPDVEGEALVVLIKQGEPQELHEYGGLYALAGPSAVIADFGRPPPPRIEGKRELPEAKDPAKWPADALVMVVETDDRGKPAMIPGKRVGSVPRPRGAKLVMTAAGGGFVPFEPTKMMVDALQMRRAPEGGYEREMRLTTEHYDQILSSSRPIYFYFKADGKYGRGRLSYWRVDPKTGKTVISFSLKVQPDGTTNLETERTWNLR